MELPSSAAYFPTIGTRDGAEADSLSWLQMPLPDLLAGPSTLQTCHTTSAQPKGETPGHTRNLRRCPAAADSVETTPPRLPQTANRPAPRTKKRRTRSGCKACRERRVKCDEGSPGPDGTLKTACRTCIARKTECLYPVAQPARQREWAAPAPVPRHVGVLDTPRGADRLFSHGSAGSGTAWPTSLSRRTVPFALYEGLERGTPDRATPLEQTGQSPRGDLVSSLVPVNEPSFRGRLRSPIPSQRLAGLDSAAFRILAAGGGPVPFIGAVAVTAPEEDHFRSRMVPFLIQTFAECSSAPGSREPSDDRIALFHAAARLSYVSKAETKLDVERHQRHAQAACERAVSQHCQSETLLYVSAKHRVWILKALTFPSSQHRSRAVDARRLVLRTSDPPPARTPLRQHPVTNRTSSLRHTVRVSHPPRGRGRISTNFDAGTACGRFLPRVHLRRRASDLGPARQDG